MNITAIDVVVTDFVKDVGVPVAVALIGLVGAVIATAVAYALGRWGDALARRRDGYAEAIKTLFAYREYAWKIRRRSSDTSEELGRLAAEGHDLQERLRYHQSWICSENRWVGRVYREVRDDLAAEIGPACNIAWNTPPVDTAAGMCLGTWGPADLDAHIERFESAKAFRFGWRQIVGLIHFHPGVVRRPERAVALSGRRRPAVVASRLGVGESEAGSTR